MSVWDRTCTDPYGHVRIPYGCGHSLCTKLCEAQRMMQEKWLFSSEDTFTDYLEHKKPAEPIANVFDYV